MSLHSKIVTSFRKLIAQSGQILDDDVIYLDLEDWVEKKEPNQSYTLLFVGAVVAGVYSILQNKIEIFYASALISTLPVITPHLVSFYYDHRSKRLRNDLENLLEEFRILSKSNSDRIDFLNSYKRYLESSQKPFITLTNDAVIDLFSKASNFQSSIINMMLDILSDLHEGLKDFVFESNEYADALLQELKYDTLESCSKNANILDARLLLIRSHFWISMYLLCTKKGDPQHLVHIMSTKIPPLFHLIQESNSQMKIALDKIRFFEKKSLVLPSFKHLPRFGPINFISRIKRDVISLNNNICCTLMNAKKVSIMIDDEHLEEILDELGEALSKITKNIYDCYETASDLKKSIEVLHRHQKNLHDPPEDNPFNDIITVDNDEIPKVKVDLPDTDNEEDEEFEAFTTGDSHLESESVDDDTVADTKLLIEQQRGMIRELRKHIKFLEKKQNLEAKEKVSPLEVPPETTPPKEIYPSRVRTSLSSIQHDDASEDSTEDTFDKTQEENQSRITENPVSEVSMESLRMEMAQRMRVGLGGDVASNLSNLMRESISGDGRHNAFPKLWKREEETFE